MDEERTPPPGGFQQVGTYRVLRKQNETEEQFQKRVRLVARMNKLAGGDPVGQARSARTAGRVLRLVIVGIAALILAFLPMDAGNSESVSLLKTVVVRVLCSAAALACFFFATRMLIRQRRENAERAPLRTGGN